MTPDELFEAALGAHRERTAAGEVMADPSWRDLSPEDRERLFTETERLRRLEAAIDPEGLSGTARAVLARIRR